MRAAVCVIIMKKKRGCGDVLCEGILCGKLLGGDAVHLIDAVHLCVYVKVCGVVEPKRATK